MPIRTIGAGLLLAAGLVVASAAHADPVTYTQTIDHVTLRMPAPIGPKSDVTVTLAAQADTDDIVAVADVFGWPGKCVLTTSATITVTGVPTQTFASPIPVYATNSGEFDYMYGVNDTFPNTAASTFVADTAAAPPPAAVPTLSEWAMILMGVVLASLAALQLIRPAGLTAFFPRAGR